MVIALMLLEYRRSFLETRSQFNQVPIPRPIAVHEGSAIPLKYASPGIPMSSQLLISEASALIAVTRGPILRPPK